MAASVAERLQLLLAEKRFAEISPMLDAAELEVCLAHSPPKILFLFSKNITIFSYLNYCCLREVHVTNVNIYARQGREYLFLV